VERDINVFKEVARSDAAQSVGRLDQVVHGLSGVFAAESVGEDERLSELTSVHEETSAVGGPRSFNVHKNPPLGGGLLCS
jgi:hypothetical protein